jgi:hypothetical protein
MSDAGALIGASAALLGASIGGFVSVWVERIRSHAANVARRREELIKACSAFTAAITRAKYLAYRDRKPPPTPSRRPMKRSTRFWTKPVSKPPPDEAINEVLDQARVECERLRILLDHKDVQEAARLALRHIYAVWMVERDGVDPRAAEYRGQSPSDRLRSALTTLYIGVRAQAGVERPEEVFEELDN